MKNKLRAAGYLRLSRDDGDKAESDSIKNQRLIINDYAKSHGFTIDEEFSDDGYSGTNFERPGFKRLMAKINEGDINCIIVKDLSRLGRNYIEMGRLMTKIFPTLGIRLISVVDNYDSISEDSKTDQLIIPFKNLINDAYCRDMSMKVRSQLDVKRKKGMFIGSFAAYGYMKDEKDHNHLIIDEAAAKVVEMIFNLRLDGYSADEIAKKLNQYAIVTPTEYKRMHGMNYYCGLKASIKSIWQPNTVRMILNNRLYTGCIVQGKTKKVNYKIRKSVKLPREQWIVVPYMHDPIISENVFEEVRRLENLDTRASLSDGRVHILGGLVKCADCGQNMVMRSITRNDKKYYYYHCSTYKSGNSCSSHIISEDKLKASVLVTIRRISKQIDEANEKFKSLEEIPKNNVALKLLDSQISEQKQEIEKISKMKVRLYMDYLEGIVDKNEYMEINRRFAEKLADLSEKVMENENKRNELVSLASAQKSWIKEFLSEKGIKELNRRCCIRLLEKVEVRADKSVVCVFRHQDEINEFLMAAINA